MDRKKKIWFITGISRGLGKALAEAALERGDTVIGTSRSGEADLVQHRQQQGRLHVLPLDVTDRESVFAAVKAAYDLYWRLDVVVNNAGFGLLGAMEETVPEEFNDVMNVNFFGTVHVMQAALPYLRAQRSGHIVNLSSIAGLAPVGGYSFYAAAKFAVEGLSTAVAQEVKEHGIKMTIVEPGAFRTEFLNDSSIKYTAEPLDAYAASAGQTKTKLAGMNGKQQGDPQKAAEAMLEAIDSDSPPLHLLLGSDAYMRMSDYSAALQRELSKWQSLTLSTDYEEISSGAEKSCKLKAVS